MGNEAGTVSREHAMERPFSDFRLGIARVSLKFFKVVRTILAPVGTYYRRSLSLSLAAMARTHEL
ncbi:hypothetical protein CABS01_12282 [Colletotrichum abscissum]|uniref:uncharacterized protein n=1 Tax=Colletotrichum abscissum TaxID=1671311 RepID=UPI0027D5B041|nr:uncharacterized protein CABS01_12282 [Colletotrichum abscissum]KAK1491189.1 hypothetical protein CABS01_12282 [Colletotrichum abscissum]